VDLWNLVKNFSLSIGSSSKDVYEEIEKENCDKALELVEILAEMSDILNNKREDKEDK
jgi:hypothetical protein